MPQLTTSMFGRACRIFMGLAYPAGAASIPQTRRCFFEVDESLPVAEYLPGATRLGGLARTVCNAQGEVDGYEFRLGSEHFPHLKLRVQEISGPGAGTLVFMVDTHDAFSKDSRLPPDDHPDALAWRQLQQKNRELKERIETALEDNGLITPNKLLRAGLDEKP